MTAAEPAPRPAPRSGAGSAARSALRMDAGVRRGDFRLDVSLEAEEGVVVLFGPSGAGKSTALEAIAGLVSPEAGEIALAGETLFRRGRDGPAIDVPARRRRIGYVFQSYALFPHLSALENVAFPLRGVDGGRRRALDLLARMSLEPFADRFPAQLSGGQQQRVAIARALAADPRALLLDEPFAALDLETRRSVRGEIRKVLRELRIPVLLVTHDREDALALGDRLVILDSGKIVADGVPAELLGRPARERVARLVGVENLLRLEVAEILPREGVMRCIANGVRLEVPRSDVEVGASITVGVRADDILLATQAPSGLSARNILPGRVTSIERVGPLNEVTVDCGVSLAAHLTDGAVAELALRQGTEVWAVLKSASCLVLREDG